VIKTHRAQRSFGDGLIAAEVKDLHEAWMRHPDQLLGDPQIVAAVYEALAQRHPQSRKRGRSGTPAEVVLRLLVLKHMRNWSYGVLEREVRANLVYRDFTGVGGEKAPDAKTMGKWGVALGPEVVKQIHERIVQIARDHRVAPGRRMRVDTTVVETNIHYPTDSNLLGDGVRVLTRLMKKITGIAGAAGTKLRDRSRSVKLRVLEIARAARAKGHQNSERLAQAYRKLLVATGRVVSQARRFAKEIDDGVKRAAEGSRQVVLERLRRELESMAPLVQQVMRQTKARVFAGDTHAEGKIVSLFDPTTEVIRKSLPSRKRGQGRQADRIRQNGQTAGGGEPDRHRLRGLRSAAQRFGHPDGCDRNPSGEAGSGTAPGRCGCRFLLGQKRSRRKGQRRQARVHPQSLHQEPGAQARAEEALVP
jgi:IS5 family transposase